MNTVQFDVACPITQAAMLAEVRRLLTIFPIRGVVVRRELVAPKGIVWTDARPGGRWNKTEGTITLSRGLLEPGRVLDLVSVMAHELAHAQQVHVGTYQHLTGWDRMMAYARCPYELQANLVGHLCAVMWDARLQGRAPENAPPERWQAVVDWVTERQVERIRKAQEELPALKGLSDAELYPHSRRLGLSWRPTSG